MSVKLNLIAAVCENMGIGKNNDLPWRLKKEMAYFTRMTSTTKDPSKKNVVIMGSNTWRSIPPKFKPLSNRINLVLSRQKLDLSEYADTYHAESLESAIGKLDEESFRPKYENVWVIGGSHIYTLSLQSPNFYRLYLTEIRKDFDCDTFFPALKDSLKLVRDPDVPEEVQEENGVEYVFKVFENSDFGK